MSRKLLFLFNPHAGRTAIRDHLLEILDTFVKGDCEVTVRTTQRAGELPELIRDMTPGYDLLVTCGGDGTLNETVNGLIKYGISIPCGFIPAGTVNDFATTLKISKNMEQAAKDIVDGTVFRCDVGKYQDRYFSYVAAFGAFTDVSYGTPQNFKNLLGRGAYLLDGIAHLPMLKSCRLRFEYDGNVIEDDFLFGMASNSISVGGMPLNSHREVTMDDGLLEVLLIKKPHLPFDPVAMVNSLQNMDESSEFFYAFKTNELHVTTLQEEPVPWALDGEYGGNDREVTIGVMPRALPIIVPLSDNLRRLRMAEQEEAT